MVRLAAQPRVLPKGNVVVVADDDTTSSSLPRTLDPPCYDQLQTLERSCVTTNLVTSSPVAMIPRPNRSFQSMQAEFDIAKKEATELFEKIVLVFEREENQGKKKYFDSSFFPGSQRTLYPPGSPEDTCTVGRPSDLKRATELFKPVLFSPSATGIAQGGSELIQGQLGDGHLVAAMKILGAEHFKKLIVASDVEKGIYAVLSFAVGTWEYVIVDDLLPVDEKGEPLFLSTKSKSELFPVIIEKAFAKLHGSFDAIDGGYTAATLSTFTGGVRMSLDLKNLFWKDFLAMSPTSSSSSSSTSTKPMLCAALNPKAPAVSVCGIPKDRSFLIKDIIETKERVGFVVLQHLLPFSNSSSVDENKQTSAQLSSSKIESSAWKSPQHTFSNPPTVSDSTCFVVPAVDFRQYFVCDAVFINDLASTPYYNIEGVADSGQIGQGEDVFIIKLHKTVRETTKLQFAVGQLETRFICPMLGESQETHTILKGGADWGLKTFQLGVRVFYHPDGVPRPDNFPLSKKIELRSRVITHAETVLIEIDFPSLLSKQSRKKRILGEDNDDESAIRYLSVIPICDSKTPYYVTVMNLSQPSPVAHDDITIFRLSDALSLQPKLLLGRTQGIVSTQGDGESSLKFEPERDALEDDYVQDDDDDDDENDTEDDYEEYWCPEGEVRKGPSREQLRAMFDQFDIDMSGALEASELTALFLHHFHHLSPKAVQTKIKAADANADGKISFKEFRMLAKELFQS